MNHTTKKTTDISPNPSTVMDLRMDETFKYPEILNAEVLWMTNKKRIEHELPPLVFSDGLQRMAMFHSRQMQQHQFFSHVNPYDNRVKTLSDRINAFQLDSFITFGENIAKYPMLKAQTPYTVHVKDGKAHFFTKEGEIFPYTCTEFARVVVDGWMNSPGHRANILNPNFEYLGCGCSRVSQKRPDYKMIYYILIQNFGGKMIQTARPSYLDKEFHYLITGRYKIPLIKGHFILCLHIAGCQKDTFAKAGEVVEKNGLLGIRNLSPYTWTVALPDKSIRLVYPGKGMPVRPGLRIRVGNHCEWSTIS